MQNEAWLDRDTILIARDWGDGTMTKSGYPFVVKTLKRGEPLSSAREIYRGAPSDQVGTFPMILSDGSGNRAAFLYQVVELVLGVQPLAWHPPGDGVLRVPGDHGKRVLGAMMTSASSRFIPHQLALGIDVDVGTTLLISTTPATKADDLVVFLPVGGEGDLLVTQQF